MEQTGLKADLPRSRVWHDHKHYSNLQSQLRLLKSQTLQLENKDTIKPLQLNIIGNPHSYLYTANGNSMRDERFPVMFLNLLRSKVKWKLFYDAKIHSFIHSFIFAIYTKYYNGAGLLCLVKCDEGRKVDFQVLCLQVGGSRKISEVQVRVCYYW